MNVRKKEGKRKIKIPIFPIDIVDYRGYNAHIGFKQALLKGAGHNDKYMLPQPKDVLPNAELSGM